MRISQGFGYVLDLSILDRKKTIIFQNVKKWKNHKQDKT